MVHQLLRIVSLVNGYDSLGKASIWKYGYTNEHVTKLKNIRIDIIIIWRVNIPWNALWLSMFKELPLTGGIGAKTAQCTH